MLLDEVIDYKIKDEQFYNKATETSVMIKYTTPLTSHTEMHSESIYIYNIFIYK